MYDMRLNSQFYVLSKDEVNLNNVYIHFFALPTCVYTEGRMRLHFSTKILVHAHVSGVLIINTGRQAHLVTGRELLLSHMIVSLRDSLIGLSTEVNPSPGIFLTYFCFHLWLVCHMC